MNKTIKYLLCLRADSPNVLKLLIVFNVILSLYLLFIYGAGVQNEHQIPIQRRPLPYRMNNRLGVICSVLFIYHALIMFFL